MDKDNSYNDDETIIAPEFDDIDDEVQSNSNNNQMDLYRNGQRLPSLNLVLAHRENPVLNSPSVDLWNECLSNL